MVDPVRERALDQEAVRVSAESQPPVPELAPRRHRVRMRVLVAGREQAMKAAQVRASEAGPAAAAVIWLAEPPAVQRPCNR